jgi:hypothetical protein
LIEEQSVKVGFWIQASGMNKSWMLEGDLERPTTARGLRERNKVLCCRCCCWWWWWWWWWLWWWLSNETCHLLGIKKTQNCDIIQGYTDQVAWVAVPNICGSSAWKLLQVIMTHGVFRWLVELWKFVGPWHHLGCNLLERLW